MKHSIRQLVMVLAVAVNLFYLVYRAWFTLNLASPYAVFASSILYLAELHGFLWMLFFFFEIWSPLEPTAPPPLEGKTVDVLVPTYNEDIPLLRATLLACVRMTYPHRTLVLDDGNRPEVRALAEELAISYIAREDNQGAKAGNLNNALKLTDGEFVAVFDADHVPEPEFLTKLMGYFRDEKLAVVQTPHTFYNLDAFQVEADYVHRKMWDEQELFFQVVQPGKNRWNAAFFAGSSALIRRRALEEIGYFASETITEDLHTSIRLHSKGWKTLYHNERLSHGLAAKGIKGFHGQRIRWAEGNLSVLAYDNPLTIRGLTFPQRLAYFTTIYNWTQGLAKFVFYLTPILWLFSGVHPIRNFDWPLAILFLTYLTVTLGAAKFVSGGRVRILDSELFHMANFFVLVQAMGRALFRRKRTKFRVTKKRGGFGERILPQVTPHLVLAGFGILAIFWGSMRLGYGITDDVTGTAVGSFWALIHSMFALIVVRRALRSQDQRFAYRFPSFLPVVFTFRAGDGGRRLRRSQHVLHARHEQLRCGAAQDLPRPRIAKPDLPRRDLQRHQSGTI